MKFSAIFFILISIVVGVVTGLPISRDSAKDKWVYNDTDQTLYMYKSETVSFSVAKAQCEALGATLVSSLARIPGNGENWVGLQRDAQDASKIFYVSGRAVLASEYPDNVEDTTYDAQQSCYYSIDAEKPIRHASCTDKKSAYCERPVVDRPTTEWQRLNDVMEMIIVPLLSKQEDVAQHCNDLFSAQPLFINNEVTAKDLILPAMIGDPLIDVNEGIFTGILQNDTSITYLGEVGFHTLLGTTDRFTTGTTPSSSLAPKLVGNNGNPSFSSVSVSTELPFGCSRIIRQISSFSTKPSGNTVDVGKSVDVEVSLDGGVMHGDGRYFVYSDPPANAWVSPNIAHFPKCVNASNCTGSMLTQTLKIHGVTAGNIKLHVRAMSTLEIARSVSPIDFTVKPLPSITFSPTSITVRIRETKQVTATLSQRFDSSVINASFLPPTDPCVNFGPMIFSEGSTTTTVRVTGITKCNVAKEYLVIPEAPTGNLYAPIPKLSVEVVDPIQLAVTGAQFLYDGSTSTQEGISMEPSAELPKAITVTLSHNCSTDLFKLSVTSFHFTKKERRTTMVRAEPIEGKWMHCAISFTASNLYATAQPNAHVMQVRRQSELKFTQFPTLMMPGAVEPVHVSIDQYWPTQGEVRFAVSVSGMEPSVTCQDFVFSNAQTSITPTCQAGNGKEDDKKTAQVTYTLSGSSTNLRSFRPAANHIRPTMKMTDSENGKFLMQFHSADLRYDNCYDGVNKKFIVWSKAELFNVDTDWEWQPNGGGCQSMPRLKKYNPIVENGKALAGSFETYCNTGERTIKLPAAPDSGSRFVDYENKLSKIQWKDANDRPVPTVSAPSTRSIKAGEEATIFVSLPKPVASQTVTVTMASSASSMISVLTTQHVFSPGDEQINGIPMRIKAENVAATTTAVITVSVTAADPTFLPSRQLYQQTWTARVVKQLQVTDADPSAKNCFVGAFEVNINFGSFTPVNDFTFELYIVSGFNADSITISPATRTLNSGATAATFTVSSTFFSPGKFKFSAKCSGSCPLDVGFGSAEVTIDALRYLTMSLPNSGMIRTGQSGTASVKHIGSSTSFSSEIENVVTSGLSVADSKTFIRESQTDTLKITAGEIVGRQTITATPLSAKVFMNHNFVLPVEVYGPATGSVSMATPQPMVVGSGYSIDFMLGQLAGTVTASHDGSSSSTDLDKNLQLGVSPSSYMFSASTRSTRFVVTPSHPVRRQLKFSMSGNTQFTSHSQSPDDFWAVSKLSIGLDKIPEELVSGELNKRTFTISAGNTPQRVSGTSFTIALQGDNTGNLTLNVSSFSRGWGNDTESIPVEMLGSGDAKITIIITPDPTTWYDTVSSHTITVLRLLKVYTELDFSVLYGTKDIAELSVTTEKLLNENKTLILTPSYNVSVLESTPTVYTFTSNDTNDGMVFNLSAVDWYVAPSHGEAVLVKFSLSGTDGLLFTQHRTVELLVLPHLNFSISNNGHDVVYDGPENAVDFTISISKLPKKSRLLNLTVSCVLLSAEADASCSLSRSWVAFSDSSDLSQNVSVTTVGVANVSVVIDADQDTTNATEFHPYVTAFTNVSAVDKLKTTVSVINGTKFLPIGATATLNVSTVPQLLALTESVELTWSFDVGTSGVSSSPTSLSWDSSAASSSSLVFSPTIDESACPQDASVKLSVKAPSKYYSVTHPQHANFTIVAPKDINVTTYSQNLFLNADQRSGHINITVPRPNNTVSREVVNLTISCNSSILSFIGDTFRFSETELFHQVWVASSNTTTGSALCYLHFYGDLDFEYRETAIAVTFVVHDQIDVAVDVKHSVYVNVDEIMQLSVTNAIHLCEPGTSINVVATFSTNSSIDPLTFAWVSGSGGQLQSAKKFKSSTVMTAWATFAVSGSCFAVNTTMDPRNITFFPPDKVAIYNLPRYLFIDEPKDVLVEITHTLPLETTRQLNFEPKYHTSQVGDVLAIAGFIRVPPNSGATNKTITLTGKKYSPSSLFSVSVTSPSDAKLVFVGNEYFGSNVTEIPRVMTPTITSNLSHVAPGFQLGVEGTVFHTEVFTVNVSFPSSHIPVVLDLNVTFDEKYFEKLDETGSAATGAFVVFYFKTKVGSAGKTEIGFSYKQSGNLYHAPRNGTIWVRERKEFTLVGDLPRVVRVGGVNGREFKIQTLFQPTLPVGAPRVRLTPKTSDPALSFSPSHLDWVESDSHQMKVFNVSASSVPHAPVDVFFEIDTVEFIMEPRLVSNKFTVLPLGKVRILDVVEKIFIGQSMIVSVSLDHPPLDVPLNVAPQMDNPKQIKVEKLDGTSDSVAHWPANSTNFTQQIEIFGVLATAGPEPFRFLGDSREFSDDYECIGRTSCTVHIIPTAKISAEEECKQGTCRPIIMYTGEKKSLTVTVKECYNQSKVTVKPSFDDFPNALSFSPESAIWDCSKLTGTSSDAIVFNMTAQAGSAQGQDPTTRAAVIYVESREDAGSLPKSRNGAFAMSVYVRAEQKIDFQLKSNISYYKPVNITIKPGRFPVKGPITVKLSEKLNGPQYLTMEPKDGVSWGATFDDVVPEPKTISILPLDMTTQVDKSEIMMQLQLTGSTSEFYLSEGEGDMYTFLNFTLKKTPRVSIVPKLTTEDYFVGINYEVTVSLSEAPEPNDPFQMLITSSASTGTRKLGISTPLSPSQETTKTLRISYPETSTIFRFASTYPGDYDLSYSFDAVKQKYAETIDTTLNNVTLNALIHPNLAELQKQLSSEQYIRGKNTQKVTLKLPVPPGGEDMESVRVALKWVTVDGLDPPITNKTNNWARVENGMMSKDFSISRNEPTATGVTPGSVVLVFDAAPPQYATKELVLGTIRFLPLFSIQDPTVKSYEMFLGQKRQIPIVVNGVPPPTDRGETTYTVILSDQAGLTTVSPSAQVGVSFTQGSPFEQYFNITADKGRTGDTKLQFQHATVPNSFDVRKSVSIAVKVKPLEKVALTSLGDVSMSTIEVFREEIEQNVANAVYLKITVARVRNAPTGLKVSVTPSNPAAVAVYQEFVTTAATFTFPESDNEQSVIFRVVGLKTDDDLQRERDEANEEDNPNTPPPDTPVGINIVTSGTDEIDKEAYYPIIVKPLFTFRARAIPSQFFAGENNGDRFFVQPEVPSNITLNCDCDGSVGAVLEPAVLKWSESNNEQQVYIHGSSDGTCFLTCRQEPTLLQSTFVSSALGRSIKVMAAPETSLTFVRNEELTDRLTAADFRELGMKFRITIGPDTLERTKMLLPTENITFSAVDPEASFLLSSDVSREVSPKGFLHSVTVENSSVSWTVDELTRDKVDVVIAPMKDYVSYEDERITVTMTRKATIDNIYPNEERSNVSITILGDPPPPPDEVEKKVMEGFIFGAASISGLMSLSSAAQAGKVLTISNLMRCPSQQWIENQEDLPFYVVLVPFSLGSNDDLGGYAGAVVSNSLVVMFLGLCHFGVCKVLKWLRREDEVPMHDVMASLAFPSLSWFPVMLFYQTTFISAGRVLLYSPVPTFKVITSLVVIAQLFAAPAVLVRLVTKGDDLEYVRPQRKGWLRWLFERGSYRHPTNVTWVPRFALPLTPYRGEAKWFVCVEMAVIISLGMITAAEPKDHDHCITRTIVAFIIFAGQLIAMLLVQPFSSKFENFFYMVAYVVQCIAMGWVMGSTIRKEDGEADTHRVLIFFGCMLIVKAIVDWWGALQSGAQMCAVLDPQSSRNFRSARTKEGQLQFETEEGLLTVDEKNDLEEQEELARIASELSTKKKPTELMLSAAEAEQKSRVLAPLATATVVVPMKDPTTGAAAGGRRVLTGFQRAIDPSVAAYDDHQLQQRDYNKLDIDPNTI